MSKAYNEKKLSYGIKVRMFLYVIPLVVIPQIVANFTSYYILNDYVETMVLKQLQQSNEDIFEAYSDFIEEIDENTIRIITYKTIQESLAGEPLSTEKMLEIRKYLATYIYDFYEDLYYIDNKNNVITTTMYNSLDAESIMNYSVANQLEGTYAQMKIAMDYESVQGSILVARNIRHIEINKSPGTLIIRINPKIFERIFREDILVKNSQYILVDNLGFIAYHNSNPELIGQKFNGADFVHDNKRYIHTQYIENNANWKIVSFISRKDVFSLYNKYQFLMFAIVIVTTAIAIFMVIYLSKRFTEPIEGLTHAMMDFDKGKFKTRLDACEQTEIGDAARSFNHMADEISELLKDIHEKQEELRKSELKILVHQINPHFIYNTLDNINMLLRMSGDDKTSRLVQSLSRFLRISLSKGQMYIKLKDEFDHGKYYMDIQSIRYDGLFEYSIDIQEGLEDIKINKFILQPILENSIKHGFSDRYNGGKIEIKAYIQNDMLVISVLDNGVGISPEKVEHLNSLNNMSISQIQNIYPEDEGGYGISNVISRLKLSYSDGFSLKYFPLENGTECRLQIGQRLLAASIDQK